jgi:hypothetical protein
MFKEKPASRAELAARKVFKPETPKPNDYAKSQKTFHDNRERLKAERLAREAAASQGDGKTKSES